MDVRSALVITILSIFGAHALAYLFVGVLPDAAVISLGLESARSEVVAAFQAANGVRPYSQVMTDAARFNFGTTLDGIPVSQELAYAFAASVPRLVLAGFAIVLVSLMTALFAPVRSGVLDRAASFLAFLPPYIMPFLGVLIVLSIQTAFGTVASDALTLSVTVAAIAIVPGALAVAQTVNITRRNLESDFARTLTAIGARTLYRRVRLLHNVAAEITPSLEKMFTGMVAALLFAEPILGLSGFGTTAVRAVRRSDPDLLLGVTLALAIVVAVFRLFALVVRRHYGLRL